MGDHDQIIQYTTGHLCTTFEDFIFIYVAIIAKIEFDLLLSVNNPSDVIVTKLKLNSMSFHLLNVCKKIQIDISKHAEKSPENADGRTDRRMDIVTGKYVHVSNGRIKGAIIVIVDVNETCIYSHTELYFSINKVLDVAKLTIIEN